MWKERGGGWEIGLEKCAFCGRDIDEVEKLIKAPNSDVYICETCARIVFNLSDDSINQRGTRKRREELAKAIAGTRTVKKGPAATPAEIHRQLDRYIIGQEKVKKILSVAIYNHSKRLKDKRGLIKKSNILLLGSTGCGKTLLAQTLAKMLDLPFAIVDATRLTEAGYVGDDVEVCLQRLMAAAGGDMELAQKGVVYIDEIDKIACKGPGGRDIGGRGVQAALLKLVEGCEASVLVSGDRRNPNADYIIFDTTNVLFMVGGAFDGLMDGHKREKHIGFSASCSWAEAVEGVSVSTEDLMKYGMMPELIGRFPVICTLDGLEKDDLVRILTEPEDAITKEYGLLLKKDGVRLVFEQEALEEIAGIAIERKTGARGLRSIIEGMMLETMYSMPGRKDISKCVVTADSVKSGQPLLIPKRQKNGGADDSAKTGREKAEVKGYKESGGC